MASGLTGPLSALLGVQAVVAFPLFLPFASVRGPTLALFKGSTAGPGGYVGITILATLFVILASSIWEGVTLQAQEHGDQYKSMMTAVQLAQARLVTAMCAANILISLALCKLSHEMRTHSKLMTSHAALTKQAAGISQEYTRATQAQAGAPKTDEALTKRCSELQDAADEAQTKQKAAEKELSDVKMLKNLERSFDELMKQNMNTRDKPSSGVSGLGVVDECDDFLSESMHGAPRSRAAARNKDA